MKKGKLGHYIKYITYW